MPDYSGKYLDGPGLEHLMGKIKQLIDSGGVVLDPTPTSGSANAVESGGVYTALQGKQDALTFDSAPTDGSSNPVTSDGIYTALDDKADASHGHAAGDVTSGTFAIGRIPTGTTASTVALGNHTHSAYAAASHDHAAGDITSGTLAKARGGTGADGSSVAANRVLASPNGSTGAISFRALVAADIPTLAATKIEPIYYQARGSGTVTATAGEQIQVPLVTTGALYDGSGLSIASSGIKIATAGRYRISGAVYIRSVSGMTARGCYIRRSTSSGAYSASEEIITATEEGNVAGAINAGPKVLQCAANDIIYLAGRAVGANSTIEKANVGTYLLVERLS